MRRARSRGWRGALHTLRMSRRLSGSGWKRPVGDDVRLVNAEERELIAPFLLRPVDFGVMYPGVREPDFGVFAPLEWGVLTDLGEAFVRASSRARARC